VKKLTIFGLAAFLIVGLVAVAGAHKPEGELFFAFQFNDDSVPVIDGNHADWSFIPADPYEIRNDRLFSPAASIRDVGRGAADPSEANIRHRIGYNANDEFLYFSTEMFDDYHDIDREDPGSLWRDDDWEVRVNPSAVSAEEHNPEGAPTNFITYVHAVPPLEGVYERILPGEDKDWMVDGGGNLEFGWSFTGEMVSGEGTYYYEMKLRPVVALGETAEDTEWMDMEEGEQLHLNVTMADTDAPQPATYNGFWAISPGPGNNPEVDFVLAPLDDVEQTAVEEVSWGMIKAGISE